MKRNILIVWVILTALLPFLGCTIVEEDPTATSYSGSQVDPIDDSDPLRSPDGSPNHNAIVEFAHPDFDVPGRIEEYSRAKVIILQPAILWDPDFDPTIVDQLKSFNPDVKVVGYVSAHATWTTWLDLDPEQYPYQAAWSQAVRPYWSYTTTGDTMMSWPKKILINVLEEDCRNAMVNVLAEQWNAHGNVLDGVFWDHFNTWLWVPDELEGREGEMDLDGDGIPHREDEDEMQAYREASEALIRRFDTVMGSDVIQITNGNRAVKDSSFASLVDGMMYEIFPDYGFDGRGMRGALDPDQYNNLFAAHDWPRTSNGGPFLYLTNKRHITVNNASGEREIWRRADFNRVAALLSDNLVTYHNEAEEHTYGWPDVELDLGQPLGGVMVDGDILTREFENGNVWLNFYTGTSGAPFQFEIIQGGVSVQKFRLN